MENTGFLKTVNFGGFDKKDVLAYVDSLNTKIYTLEGELEEARANGGGGAVNADLDEMLSKERAKAGELNSKVNTLTLTIQDHEATIKAKDEEIEKLKAQVDELEDKLRNAGSMEASTTDIANVFVEAQKSASAIVAQAKESAKKMDADAKSLADSVINDANQQAAKIIADAENESSAIKAKNAETKAAIRDDINNLMVSITTLGTTLADFNKDSTAVLEKAKGLIGDAQRSFDAPNIAAAPTTAKPAAAPKAADIKEEKPEKPTPKLDFGDLGDLLNAVEAEAKKDAE